MSAETHLDLISRIPETWGEYDPDDLTPAEQESLFSLVAAGLVERRFKTKLSMHGQSLSVIATVEATGEYGFAEAWDGLAAGLWNDWKQAYQEWMNGETADSSPFHCELIKPEEWRLTSEGSIAREDAENGDLDRVFSFVEKTGFFQYRPAVRGAGVLRKYDREFSNISAVNLTNWDEGAKAFAEAFSMMCSIKPGIEGNPESTVDAWPPDDFAGTIEGTFEDLCYYIKHDGGKQPARSLRAHIKRHRSNYRLREAEGDRTLPSLAIRDAIELRTAENLRQTRQSQKPTDA